METECCIIIKNKSQPSMLQCAVLNNCVVQKSRQDEFKDSEQPIWKIHLISQTKILLGMYPSTQLNFTWATMCRVCTSGWPRCPSLYDAIWRILQPRSDRQVNGATTPCWAKTEVYHSAVKTYFECLRRGTGHFRSKKLPWRHWNWIIVLLTHQKATFLFVGLFCATLHWLTASNHFTGVIAS